MLSREDEVRLRHMLDATSTAVEFTRNRRRKDLEDGQQLSLAIARLLEIIGEAASSVSEGFKQEHPDIPWRAMIGTRNRLVHGYFDVDLDIIWNIITQDLPPLVAPLRQILKISHK